MYIRFRLPEGVSSSATHFVLGEIKVAIERWARRHDVRYAQKTIKHEHRVTFDQDHYYSLFGMTWQPTSDMIDDAWFEYELVNVVGEKY